MTVAGAPATILCVGRLYCDLIFTDVPRLPSLGTEVFAGGCGLHAGGGAYITAAHFAALGHRAALASYLPAPPFRDLVLSELECAGIEMSLCKSAEARCDPQVTVSIAADGDRAFLTRKAGPALPALRSADIERVGARHVHVGELATLVERPDLLAAARGAGATVSLDCGWDEMLTAADIGELVASVDVFLPNEAEAEHMRRIGVRTPAAPLTVVKRGAAGASAIRDGQEISSAATPARAVDTTGAGDAFNAGFLSAWLAGRDLRDCLDHGNAMGARAIAQRGGFHAPGPSTEAARTGT